VSLSHAGVTAKKQSRHADSPRQSYQVFDLPFDALGWRMTHVQIFQDVPSARDLVL
jgi:hypothetical protein